ncbi:MAG TPA: peptidoglycan-binding domain-containing protein, partial [Mycobacteriales bacterium]|nr:peptidoglycan-binding domain-containing protein [Mycobacteriales bacterium]
HGQVRLARREHAMVTAEHALTALAGHLDRAAHRLHDRIAALGPGPHLVLGDVGPRVVALQHLLASAGHPAGPLDGHLGPRTDAAVRAFQREHALVEDGYVGPRTALALAVHAEGRPAELGTAVGLEVGLP